MDYGIESDGNAKLQAPPRIIIGGGSITGLSLALMLQKVGIDFVVLEAHDEIAPEVGAGIVCNANGFRVLDQLGLYDDIMATATAPVQEMSNWWPNGELQSRNSDFSDILERVIGYPMVVLDRQELLRILYKHIEHKEKVITGARIEYADEGPSGVHVTISDGRQFKGDILVGADGVHSFVRDQMWRIAKATAPGYFSDNEIDHIKCNWITLFGISTLSDPRITTGSANSTLNYGGSFGLLSGGPSRKYFFLNKALPKELKGNEIREFEQADHDKMVQEHWDDIIQHDITFGKLYSSKIRTVLVHLEGYVFPKWHFGRIITLGDAAHKLHVVTGQGAMMGIEDVVVLVNNLMKRLDANVSPSLDAAQIHEIFDETQKSRESRSRTLMNESFFTQSMHSWKNPLLKFVVVHVVPRIGFDFILSQFLNGVRPGPCLEAVPRPGRRCLVGFDDERRIPFSPVRWLVKCLAYVALILCAVWAVGSAWSARSADGGTQHDSRLARADGLFRLDMSGTLIIMLIEGWRRINKTSLLQWPLIWALLVDFVGFSVVAPFFYLTNLWVSSSHGRMQYTALSRPMILPAAKVILPAVVLLYLLPGAFGAFGSNFDTASFLAWTGNMPPWPAATCTALIPLIASLMPGEQDKFFGEKYLKHLRASYKFMFAVLTLLHLASLAWQFKNNTLLFFLPARIAELVWLVAVYLEVRHYHQIGQRLLLHVSLIVLAFLVAGPGAAAVAFWYWREEINKRGQERA
ncbi:hypothetical protein SLS62_006671 [Diatrype stigma]|uniref:FAD-binding domain-containing protein n=1 Tax=Diatrype stigma TaxID=117547 RepID=A0AAN9YRK9_9PEZI